jgi:hypothetical protein
MGCSAESRTPSSPTENHDGNDPSGLSHILASFRKNIVSEGTLVPWGVTTYNLIGLKGGSQLLVAPLGQDFIEGKLISAPTAFPCLEGRMQMMGKEVLLQRS